MDEGHCRVIHNYSRSNNNDCFCSRYYSAWGKQSGYREQDFLFKLPKRLIIGLVTLFFSTTAMIIAFSATLFLVFGQLSSLILIPIGVLTCLPITSFVTLQFPLIADLMSATYGRSIFFKERSYRYFY